MSNFVHLHVHSEFSVLDGMARIPKMVERAKELGQRAIAITDHGRLSGVPEFYQACRQYDVRPIIGQEFYLCEDVRDRTQRLDTSTGKKVPPPTYHLVILARDRIGYEILCNLSSQANSPECFYRRPRIDYSLLEQLTRKDRKHLVASSTCLSGHIANLIDKKKIEEAENIVLYMREMFPWFYLELQCHEVNLSKSSDRIFDKKQERLNRRLLKWSDKYDIPYVITNDSHYIYAKQHSIHDMWLACQTASKWNDSTRFHFDGYGYHLKSGKEIRKQWDDDIWRQSIRNIREITRDIDIVLPELDKRVWHIPVAPRQNTEIPSAVYMRKICLRQLKRLANRGGLAKDIQVYRDRLDYELRVIFDAKFEEEFLIVSDYINWARDNGIRVGPGRGSMAGVLAAFLMGIVDTDPVRYDLMFERAINLARPSLPDFDVDFPKSRLEEVRQYLMGKYNQKPYQAQQVGTFTRLGPRGTMRTILRSLGYSPMEINRATATLPDSAQIINLKASGDLKEILKDENLDPFIKGAMASHPKLYEWATELQDLVAGEGKHAAGVVISDNSFDLHKLVPTMMVGRSEKITSIATQFDMEGLKKLGVVKFDILSLATLDLIQDVIDQIGFDPFEDMHELEDKDTWRTINSGACGGVFQVEGGASRQVVRDLQLKGFEDLIAVMALGRSGANQFVQPYREGRDNPGSRLVLPDKRLRKILPRGVVLYQEQVMEIGLSIAGFDYNLVDELKEAIKYKKGKIWDELKPLFFKGGKYIKNGKDLGHSVGALNNGCSQHVAEAIWSMIFSYRGYGFNRAHATAYAMIAFQTAYLKTHYPAQFFKALLTIADVKDRPGYIDEAKQYFGIRFLPPDINKSGVDFTVEGKRSIRYGLGAIKGVGVVACQEIIDKRPFKSRANMVKKVTPRKCNSRVVNALQRIGAMETIGEQGDERIGDTELELLGSYVTSNPIDKYRKKIDKLVRVPKNLSALEATYDCGCWVGGLVERVKEITTKNNDKMAFVSVKYDGFREWDVVVFPDAWQQLNASLYKGRAVCVYGTKQYDRNNSVILEEIQFTKPSKVS